VCGLAIGRCQVHELRVRLDVCLDYRLGGGHGFGVAIPIDRVGFGQSFLTAGDRVDAVIDGCDRSNRHASAAVDAFLGMDIQHRRGCKFRLAFPRMNAVHRTHVDAGGVLRANAGIGDDKGHRVPPDHAEARGPRARHADEPLRDWRAGL